MSLSSHPELDRYFENPGLEQWKKLAEQALKGADFEKSLYNKTLEGICIQPVYCADQTSQLDYGALQTASPPLLFQALPTDSVEAFKTALQIDQESGLNGLSLDLADMTHWTPADFREVFTNWQSSQLALLIHSPAPCATEWLLPSLPASHNTKSSIYILSDPIAEGLSQGQLASQEDWQTLAQIVKQDRCQAVGINASVYHEAGAHAVQELSYLLGNVVETIDQLEAQGCSPAQVLSQMHIHLSLSQNLLMELAKLRAARILLNRMVQVYHQPELRIPVFAHSSRISLSQIDPHNNYLRQSLSTLAALLGGASGIHIDTYQGNLDPTSRRMARNIYLVLRQESGLTQVIDPAAGSWAIDQLSAELIDGAWKNFLQLESQGGFLKQLQQGLPQAEITQTAQQRLTQVATRKQSLVGINQYTNSDPIQAAQTQPQATRPTDSLGEYMAAQRQKTTADQISPLPGLKLTQAFEELRLHVQANPVRVGLLTLGSPKEFRARVEFSRSFFAIAGLELTELALPSEALTQSDSAFDILVICSSDDIYKQSLPDLLPQLAKQFKNSKLILAGKTDLLGESSTLLQGCIYMGCHVLDTFNSLLAADS